MALDKNYSLLQRFLLTNVEKDLIAEIETDIYNMGRENIQIAQRLNDPQIQQTESERLQARLRTISRDTRLLSQQKTDVLERAKLRFEALLEEAKNKNV